MKNELKALYKQDPKLAKEVAKVLGFKINVKSELKGANLKKIVQSILQTMKALEKFKANGLNLMIKSYEGGATTKKVAKLVDDLYEQLDSYEADQWIKER